MPIEILMPALSPTMTEGNLAKWNKKEGDKVKPGDVIAEIETDKATMEVEAVDEGVLGKIVVKAGTQNVKVNELIALLLAEGEKKDAIENYKPKAASPAVKKEEVKAAAPIAAVATQALNSQVSITSFAGASMAAAGKVKASPLAKRVANEAGVDLLSVVGTGPHGRIVKADVLEARGGSARGRVVRNPNEISVVPNSNIRKVIAKRLVESKQTIPHFYLNIDVELDKLMEARKDLNAEAAGRAGKEAQPAYKLSVNDFIIKAVALALKKVPAANASWSDEAILMYNNVDISVAVAIEGGLITPIVKNADQKTVVQISNEMKDLAARARANKLAPEEFQGGGFSISNLGMYGIKTFNAIINPPQSCILAVGAGEERAVIRNGEVQGITIMEATLSCDHRVVDGAVGAEFLAAFKNYVEKPSLLLV